MLWSATTATTHNRIFALCHHLFFYPNFDSSSQVSILIEGVRRFPSEITEAMPSYKDNHPDEEYLDSIKKHTNKETNTVRSIDNFRETLARTHGRYTKTRIAGRSCARGQGIWLCQCKVISEEVCQAEESIQADQRSHLWR